MAASRSYPVIELEEARVNVRSEIENTLYKYAWCYDMDEAAQIGDCFTEDAEVLFRDTGLKLGRAAVTEEMVRRRQLYERDEAPWHVISNVLITDETDTGATVKSFYTFFIKPKGGAPVLRSIGWYDDVFATEGGRWQVRTRRVLSAGDR
jgi:hypothetical protein